MPKIDFSEIATRADLQKLLGLFVQNKTQIYELLLERLREQGPTPYISFVADQPAGQERTRRYLDAFEQALRGQFEIFFSDQKDIGYKRAMEGYRLEDVYTHKMVFKKVLLESLNAPRESAADPVSINDIIFLDLLTDYSNYLLSSSFLKTRDEIINLRRNQIQQLYTYTTRAVSLFKEEQLRACAAKGIFDIFGLYSILPSISGSNKAYDKILKNTPIKSTKEIMDLATRANGAMAISARDAIIPFNDEMEETHLRAICVPLTSYGAYRMDPLFVHNQGNAFEFHSFDRNLFYHFCYFTASVFSNCLMVSKLDSKQHELHMLAARLISIKEEEEKKIAAEIHDTLTQSLTAIGYKALICQKCLDKDPARLVNEINSLTESIDDALKQSRAIISNLRPRILDDLGMIPAFKQQISDFRKETNLEIHFAFQKGFKADPKIGISLFRILQEGLQNVKHHANASTVWICLSLDPIAQQMTLRIRDNGEGFDTTPPQKLSQNLGFGLLIMRERAEDLGGRLEIHSKKGEGCSLQVTLPVRESQSQEVETGEIAGYEDFGC